MNGTLSRKLARQVDQWAIADYGIPGIVLMENAGRGCADILRHLGIAGRVVICCGKGNNAGDGFVIARHLDARGYAVKILLWSDPQQLRGDAALAYEMAHKAELPIRVCPLSPDQSFLHQELQGADWIVDALLGTGSEGAPRSPLDAVIHILNEHPARKFAVDLPSGLDCETGRPAAQTLRADHTATFVAAKIGFANPAARDCLGTVHIVEIGIPRKLLLQIEAHARLG